MLPLVGIHALFIIGRSLSACAEKRTGLLNFRSKFFTLAKYRSCFYSRQKNIDKF